MDKYRKYIKDNDYVLRISTPGCNLKCEYCRREDFNIKPISDEELLDIIKSATELGIKRLRWTGGEPTVMPNFKEIVDQARE